MARSVIVDGDRARSRGRPADAAAHLTGDPVCAANFTWLDLVQALDSTGLREHPHRFLLENRVVCRTRVVNHPNRPATRFLGEVNASKPAPARSCTVTH